IHQSQSRYLSHGHDHTRSRMCSTLSRPGGELKSSRAFLKSNFRSLSLSKGPKIGSRTRRVAASDPEVRLSFTSAQHPLGRPEASFPTTAVRVRGDATDP